jgi:ABC-type multidrug transport system ATPase subunit
MDEIRGFADHVTLLNQGKVRFTGTVPQLMAISASRRYLLHLRNGRGASNELIATARAAVGDRAEVQASGDADGEHFRLLLHDDVILGDALGSLMSSGISILGCREERSEIEEAFLLLTSGDQP